MMAGGLSDEQRRGWERDGFFIVRRLADAANCKAMRKRALELVRRADAGESIGDSYIVPESALAGAARAEDRVSKVFRVHRDVPVFRSFACDARVLDTVEAVLGPGLDCFLSQFIFKLPGALGQPWHQDAFYFPFDRGPQVGAWLAITEATLDNGPLWVLPGSHSQPVHRSVRDPTPGPQPTRTERGA